MTLLDTTTPTLEEWQRWRYGSYSFPRLYGSIPDNETELLRTPVEPAGLKHYLGFELELEWPGHPVEREGVLAGLKRRHPWLRFVGDCSLDDGVELVSQPMSYRYFRQELPAFQESLRALRALGCTSYDAGTCGLHVHQSRDAFTDAQVCRFELFLAQNARFAKRVSQRQQHQINEWCRLTPRRSELDGLELPQYVRRKLDGNADYDSKQAAVVYQDCLGTVELRLMRGTLNPAGFAKGVEFAVALMRFAARTPTNGLTPPAFMAWVAQRQQHFQHLHQFLVLKQERLLQAA